MSLADRFAEEMGQLLGPDFPSDIALAVSGGGDSMAMLYLAHNWTRVYGVRLWVVTVDHGLRPESADEAAMVAEEAATLGWPHATLRWHWNGTGNKMDAARRGRLDLIDRWRGGLEHVLLAHTRDDLAETFLMRLRRGAGVDGLAAMQARRRVWSPPDRRALEPHEISGARPPKAIASSGPRRHEGAFDIQRPCLDMKRSELRHYLRTLKGRWVEDPSNEDPTYDRARFRKLIAMMEPEGLDVDALAGSALRLRAERFALNARASDVWRAFGTQTHDILMIDPDWHNSVEPGTLRRVLSEALRYVSGAEYGPRGDALDALLDRVVSGGGGTLHGCEVQHLRGKVMIFREYSAVADVSATVGEARMWDGRWLIDPHQHAGLTVRALGEDGWAQVTEKPQTTPPRRAALSLPSVWDGARLVSCNALGFGPADGLSLRWRNFTFFR